MFAIVVRPESASASLARTFNYTMGSTVGGYLLSATNPENGTVSYTWKVDGATKTDAKGQVFSYTHAALYCAPPPSSSRLSTATHVVAVRISRPARARLGNTTR